MGSSRDVAFGAGKAPASLTGALFKSFLVWLVVAAVAELGIGWLITVDQGYDNPDLWFILDMLAWHVGRAIPDLPPDIADNSALILPVAAALALTLYLLPAINAYRRAHPHRVAILLVNLILGTMGVFWIVALIWSAFGGGGGARAVRNRADLAKARRSIKASISRRAESRRRPAEPEAGDEDIDQAGDSAADPQETRQWSPTVSRRQRPTVWRRRY